MNFDEMLNYADQFLFYEITKNPKHVLYSAPCREEDRL